MSSRTNAHVIAAAAAAVSVVIRTSSAQIVLNERNMKFDW